MTTDTDLIAMAPDLLPCPFCGGSDLRHQKKILGYSEAVWCPCGVDYAGSLDEWNTRALTTPPADEALDANPAFEIWKLANIHDPDAPEFVAALTALRSQNANMRQIERNVQNAREHEHEHQRAEAALSQNAAKDAQIAELSAALLEGRQRQWTQAYRELDQLRADNERLREAGDRVSALPRSTMDCGTQWVRFEEVISAIRGEKQ